MNTRIWHGYREDLVDRPGGRNEDPVGAGGAGKIDSRSPADAGD